MKSAKDPGARFAAAYDSYLKSRFSTTLDVMAGFIAELNTIEFWERRRDVIYGEGFSRRHSSPSEHPVPQPVHQVKARVKYVDSLKLKMAEMVETGELEHDEPRQHNFDLVNDIYGVRIVVYFPLQLTWIDHVIRNDSRFELASARPKAFQDLELLNRVGLKPDDFDVRGRKINGYSSVHYTVRISQSAQDQNLGDASKGRGRARPWFEIQARTVAEELWGEVEHHIGYKGDSTAFSVRRQFRVLSDHLNALNMHLDFIYDEMQNFQTKAPQPGAPLNSENIPRLLSDSLITISQDELDAAVSILRAWNITSAGQLKKRLSYKTRQMADQCWRAAQSGPPRAIDILQTVCSLSPRASNEDIRYMVELLAGVRAFRQGVQEMGFDAGT